MTMGVKFVLFVLFIFSMKFLIPKNKNNEKIESIFSVDVKNFIQLSIKKL